MKTKFRYYHFLAPKYWLTWLGLGIMRICVYMPFPWQIKLGSALGTLTYWLIPERRKVSRINIKLCYPHLSKKEQQNMQKNCYRNLGIAILEAGLSWWGSEKKLKSLYEIEGLEYIEDSRHKKKPVLLLSGHMTCSDLAARMFSFHSPFQALYKPANNKLFETIMLNARSRHYEAMVDRKATKELLRGLKALIPTWYAPDQNFPHENTVFVPFFGVPTATLTAPARIAKITNASVIPFFPYRKDDDSGYKIILSPPLENFPSEDPVADATRINLLIENAVKKAPSQYMWVHKRFRTRPDGEQAIY